MSQRLLRRRNRHRLPERRARRRAHARRLSRRASGRRRRAAARECWCRAAKPGTASSFRSTCRFAACAGTAAAAAKPGPSRAPTAAAPARGCPSLRARHAAPGCRRRRALPFPRLLPRRRFGSRRNSHRDHQCVRIGSLSNRELDYPISITQSYDLSPLTLTWSACSSSSGVCSRRSSDCRRSRWDRRGRADRVGRAERRRAVRRRDHGRRLHRPGADRDSVGRRARRGRRAAPSPPSLVARGRAGAGLGGFWCCCPYGTALGCYTLWALLSEEGKRALHSAAEPEPSDAAEPECTIFCDVCQLIRRACSTR